MKLLRWLASRLLVASLVGMAAATMVAAQTGPATDSTDEKLVFLTWADYIDPSVVADFEREHDIKVQFAFYESDDVRNELLANSEGRGYDVATINGLMLESYRKRNWLSVLDVKELPNLRHLEPRWNEMFPGGGKYGVAYFWGTLGIAYRKDLVPEGFTSWKSFFQPSEPLRGRITMVKNSRDVVGMALKSLGYSANTQDRKAIGEAGTVLAAQKPFVRTYAYLNLTEKSALVTGEVWAGLMYSGDALMIRAYHPDIEYVVPDEGGNLWVDYLVAFEASPRKAMARKFIDFLNRPDIAARNAEFVSYATPNLAAREHLSKAYFANAVIHPNEEVLSRSESYRHLSARSQKAINTVFGHLVN